jgi:hypothetical protein
VPALQDDSRNRTGKKMMNKLRLDIEPPVHGWATVRLSAPGVAVEFAASFTPWDSIGDLARAAAGLVAGVPEQVVAWNTEPVEYEFRFVTTSGRTRLEVHEFPDHRRHWRRTEIPLTVVEGTPVAIARPLWRGLRRLQGAVSAEEFTAGWRHPFPAAAVERLGVELQRNA